MKSALKRYVITAIAILAATLAIEVSVLITTKVTGWNHAENGRPWAVAAHVHLLVLGVVWFLTVTLLEKNFELSAVKLAKPAYIVHLCGLGATVAVILYKGFAQLTGGNVIRGLVEGGAAISHIVLFVGLLLWLITVFKAVAVKNKTE